MPVTGFIRCQIDPFQRDAFRRCAEARHAQALHLHLMAQGWVRGATWR